MNFILNLLLEMIVNPLVWAAVIYLIVAKKKGKNGTLVKVCWIFLAVDLIIEIGGLIARYVA